MMLFCVGLQGGGAYAYTSDSMLRRVHSMLQAKWAQRRLRMKLQGEKEPTALLLDDDLYRLVYRMCEALYKNQKGAHRRGPDGAPLDPQAGSLQPTFTEDQLVAMMTDLLACGTLTSAETMCMMLLMCCTAGRGDDCRERRVCELMEPMLRKCIGGQQGLC